MKTQIIWLVKTDSMFCANTSFVLGHFFEDKAVLKLALFVKDDVDMQVSITDVPIAEDERFCLFSQVIQESWPLPNIKRDIVSKHSSFFANCSHCHVLPNLPDLAVLLIIIGDYGIVEVVELLEQLIELFC